MGRRGAHRLFHREAPGPQPAEPGSGGGAGPGLSAARGRDLLVELLPRRETCRKTGGEPRPRARDRGEADGNRRGDRSDASGTRVGGEPPPPLAVQAAGNDRDHAALLQGRRRGRGGPARPRGGEGESRDVSSAWSGGDPAAEVGGGGGILQPGDAAGPQPYGAALHAGVCARAVGTGGRGKGADRAGGADAIGR